MGIQQVRTSPYHPESNGVVERMHGTLKSIIGRTMAGNHDWVECLPWALLVLRGMPHADHGYSPYDIVYGFRVHTPLVALHHCLLDENADKDVQVCDWVARLSEKVDFIRDSVVLKSGKAKDLKFGKVNDGRVARKFVVGERVLYRIPGMQSKLSDSWEGPFVVIELKGPVNCKIAKVGARKHGKVVHINSLKKYWECYKSDNNTLSSS